MAIFHSFLYVYQRVLVANNGHSKGTSMRCQVLAGDAAVSGGVLPAAVSGNEDAEFAQRVQEPLRRWRGCRGMMMVSWLVVSNIFYFPYPLVNEHSYWKWPFIVDLSIKNDDFP